MPEVELAPRRVPRLDRPAKGDRREQSLIHLAQQLIEAETFRDASVGDLAQMAGITRAGFYFYFSSKQALLASVIEAAVSDFNARIFTILAPDVVLAPAEALRTTVTAAASLWWDHRAVLSAAFELGATVPEVYDRTMRNLIEVSTPTVALLRRSGRVPEAQDEDAARDLVMALLLMMERNLYDLMRGTPTAAMREALVERLSAIWLRSFGLEP